MRSIIFVTVIILLTTSSGILAQNHLRNCSKNLDSLSIVLNKMRYRFPYIKKQRNNDTFMKAERIMLCFLDTFKKPGTPEVLIEKYLGKPDWTPKTLKKGKNMGYAYPVGIDAENGIYFRIINKRVVDYGWSVQTYKGRPQ